MLAIAYEPPPAPGNCACAVAQYRAKSALRSPARPNTARSYADETCPGVSYPSGDSTWVSSAPSSRAVACIRSAAACQPPLSAASTCTASLPELRNTPRHRSATSYVRPGATPTRLLPAPIPASSCSLTRCRIPAGSDGSTVSAKSVLRVLAGGSGRCASEAASTSPLSASATSHDSADSAGTAGAPGRGRTCTPGMWSSPGAGAAPGPPGSAARGVATAAGPRARTPAVQSAQADTVVRDTNDREENPIFI
ncbi:hypothetical protein GCM10010335_25310 [Streptomyces galbus]|nr:hypothetical protein GCM10010335_25310 [Streptomyces galbus]